MLILTDATKNNVLHMLKYLLNVSNVIDNEL